MKKLSFLLALIIAVSLAISPLSARAGGGWYDYDGSGGVDTDDAVYLLRHVLFPETYPASACDVNADGSADTDDAVYLLRHVLFPETYALCDHSEGARIADSEPNAAHDGAWHTECTLCGARLNEGVITRIDENGSFISKDDVALYLHTYGRLPKNFITKEEAKALGWKSGDLYKYAPGKSLGGDVFYNREGLLPAKSGRTWYECDIGYTGGKRNSTRLVWSNDGLIYYTDDHYESFTRLY